MLQEISKETSVIDRIKDKTGNLNHTTRCVINFKKKKAKISFTRYKAIQNNIVMAFSLCSKERYFNPLFSLLFLESLKYFNFSKIFH